MKYTKRTLCALLALLLVMMTACGTEADDRQEPERIQVSGQISGNEIVFGSQSFDLGSEKLTLNLQIRSNEVLDLSVLGKCTQLRKLTINLTIVPHISYDKFNDPFIVAQEPVDLTPIAALSALERLELNVGKIADLSPLARLPKLNSMVLWIDGEVALDALAACPVLTELALGGRGTVDLASVKDFPVLRSLRVDVYDSDWNTPDLSALSGAQYLEVLSTGASRGLRELKGVPLKKLIDINDSGDILNDLPDLSTLEYLEFSDENIDDIAPLLQRGSSIPKIILEVGAQEIDNFSIIESASDPLLDRLITSIPVAQLRTLLSQGEVTIILRVDQNRSADGMDA